MSSRPASPTSGSVPGDHWQLQDAKARFSELVRYAGERGPQHVTVNGREKAVVISAADYVRLKGELTGKLLVDLMADSPLQEVVIEHPEVRGPDPRRGAVSAWLLDSSILSELRRPRPFPADRDCPGARLARDGGLPLHRVKILS